MSIDAPFPTFAAIAMDVLGLFSDVEYMTFDFSCGARDITTDMFFFGRDHQRLMTAEMEGSDSVARLQEAAGVALRSLSPELAEGVAVRFNVARESIVVGVSDPDSMVERQICWTDGAAVQLQTGSRHYSIVGMVDEPVSGHDLVSLGNISTLEGLRRNPLTERALLHVRNCLNDGDLIDEVDTFDGRLCASAQASEASSNRGYRWVAMLVAAPEDRELVKFKSPF